VTRTLVKITSTDAEGRHRLTLDLPTDTRDLDELHEIARTLAACAGLLDGHTMAFTVTIRPAGTLSAIRRSRALMGLTRRQAASAMSGTTVPASAGRWDLLIRRRVA
jgi:hypothetical protein